MTSDHTKARLEHRSTTNATHPSRHRRCVGVVYIPATRSLPSFRRSRASQHGARWGALKRKDCARRMQRLWGTVYMEIKRNSGGSKTGWSGVAEREQSMDNSQRSTMYSQSVWAQLSCGVHLIFMHDSSALTGWLVATTVTLTASDKFSEQNSRFSAENLTYMQSCNHTSLVKYNTPFNETHTDWDGQTKKSGDN